MKGRCYNKNNPRYRDYGGRGISICNRWLESFENFLTDMGKKPSCSHSLDRINVNGNYEPSNCRWATKYEQARNTRKNVLIEYKGELFILMDLAKKLNVDYKKLWYHLKTKDIRCSIEALKNNLCK